MERHGGAGGGEQARHSAGTLNLSLRDGVEVGQVALVVPIPGQVGARTERGDRSAMGRCESDDQQGDRGDHDQQSSHGKNPAPDESLPTVAR